MANIFKDDSQFKIWQEMIAEQQAIIDNKKYESDLSEKLKALIQRIMYEMLMFQVFPSEERFNGIMQGFGQIGIYVDDIIWENDDLKRKVKKYE